MTNILESKIDMLSESQAQFVLKAMLLTGRVTENMMEQAIELSKSVNA